MEEEPVHLIRESTRNQLRLYRQQQRDEVCDINRSISEIGEARITPETISSIAQKLKCKSSVTASDLNVLTNGLMEDPNHTTIVLSTQGALRGLVRELTGQDASKQCAAAGCVCNLALADGRACNAIAKAAGPYLITALDSYMPDLVAVSAFAVGNLGGCCARVCAALAAQGALGALCAPLRTGAAEREAALYALVRLAYQMKDDLRHHHLKRILDELMIMKLTVLSSELLFILSCHSAFPENTTEDLLRKVLDDLPGAMDFHLSLCKKGEENIICCELTYLLRVLSNMETGKIYGAVLEKVTENDLTKNICKILNSGNNSFVRNSLLWFLGNLYNFNSDNAFFHTLLS